MKEKVYQTRIQTVQLTFAGILWQTAGILAGCPQRCNLRLRPVPIRTTFVSWCQFRRQCLKFSKQNLSPGELVHACQVAIDRSHIQTDDIDLVVWAPQGNEQDKKVTKTLQTILGKKCATIPLVTTTFNTGYIESASILVSLAATLDTLQSNYSLWPQITGIEHIDSRVLKHKPGVILVLASTDLGYNYATILKMGHLV